MTRQIGPYPQSPADETILNLGLGQPSPDLLPIDAIRDAAARRFAVGTDPLVLQYGAMAGYAGFREALAAFLAERYRHPVAADELVITGGTSLALSMVSQVFSRPGDVVVCGDPTYFLARGILESHHLELLGVPVDEAGLDVDVLAGALADGRRVAFCYVIPSFHNPCGVTLDPERAERLVELAERHDFVIVADEPYPMLHFGSDPAPCMMTYDRGRGRVLGLGSFSKILGPGLRLGWAHAHPRLLERLLTHGTFRSGGGLNPVMSSVVHGCIEDGFLARHVDHLRGELRLRAEALTTALEAELPQLEVTRPAGGYFVWLRLPGRDTAALLLHGRDHHRVAFTPGHRCAVTRDLTDRLRLSFSFYSPSELHEAVTRLRDAIETVSRATTTP
ncbi:MAG: PLP-dependent aminotransferase family protein [Polyangiaceae bacterium]